MIVDTQPGQSLIHDLILLEKRVPSKKLMKPRNVTHASVETLHSNYKYAMVSQCNKDAIITGNCICSKTFLYDSIIEASKEELVVVIGVDPAIKTIIVSYRATKTIKNWIANFDYTQVKYPDAEGNVLVHRGFYKATVATQDKSEKAVLALIQNPEYKGYKLQITGLSLGAALSTLSSVRWNKFLQENKLNNSMEVFSYASPRVGNEEFAQLVANGNYPVTRYSNLNDVVVHLPPRSFNYVHVAAEIYERRVSFGKTEFVNCDQSYDEDATCGLSQTGLLSFARHVFVFNKLIKLPYC
ncbi:hypothetical protein K502DRAFT_294450 [Neoconidiobolus thromboides FSU 785]|nr:hypothetical protein K502DRAFT_294450 [Neoconidiobolus thromboides FSU 785]